MKKLLDRTINKCKKEKETVKRVVYVLVTMILVTAYDIKNNVFAAPTPTPTPTPGGSLKDNIIVTGTTNLISDGTLVVTGLSAGLTVLLLLWQFTRLQSADDEGDAKVIKKKMKKIAICGIGVTVTAGLVATILGYYTK